jgi:hypothetical protein
MSVPMETEMFQKDDVIIDEYAVMEEQKTESPFDKEESLTLTNDDHLLEELLKIIMTHPSPDDEGNMIRIKIDSHNENDSVIDVADEVVPVQEPEEAVPVQEPVDVPVQEPVDVPVQESDGENDADETDWDSFTKKEIVEHFEAEMDTLYNHINLMDSKINEMNEGISTLKTIIMRYNELFLKAFSGQNERIFYDGNNEVDGDEDEDEDVENDTEHEEESDGENGNEDNEDWFKDGCTVM